MKNLNTPLFLFSEVSAQFIKKDLSPRTKDHVPLNPLLIPPVFLRTSHWSRFDGFRSRNITTAVEHLLGFAAYLLPPFK